MARSIRELSPLGALDLTEDMLFEGVAGTEDAHGIFARKVKAGELEAFVSRNNSPVDLSIKTQVEAEKDRAEAAEGDLEALADPLAKTSLQEAVNSLKEYVDALADGTAAEVGELLRRVNALDAETAMFETVLNGAVSTLGALNNVDNTADADKPVSGPRQAALDEKADVSALEAHVQDAANPHLVTKDQVGLGNADDTADADKPVSGPQQAALDEKADVSALEAMDSRAVGLEWLPALPADGEYMLVISSGAAAWEAV